MKKLLVHLSCHSLDVVLGPCSPSARTAWKSVASGCSAEPAKEVSPNFQSSFHSKVVLDEDSEPMLQALSKSFFSHRERVNGAAKLPNQDSSFPLGAARRASFLEAASAAAGWHGAPAVLKKSPTTLKLEAVPGNLRSVSSGRPNTASRAAKGCLDH